MSINVESHIIKLSLIASYFDTLEFGKFKLEVDWISEVIECTSCNVLGGCSVLMQVETRPHICANILKR